jgi:hypothetical protein
VRKPIIYVAAWLAAGVAAIALATAGVSMVGNQVTGSRPSPLSADEVRSELAVEAATTTTTLADVTDSSLPPGATASTSVAAPTVPVTSPPGSGSPTPTTTATTQLGPTPETRTYTLVGGTATLRFTADGVTVWASTPNPGYSAVTEATHDNGIRVEFRSDAHRSRVEGWWDGGPRDEVREED